MPVLSVHPIGVIHTPFPDKASAPRQSYVARDAIGTIVLESGQRFEDALADVAGWDYLWVIYWCHLNDGWRPKVLPPRSKVRRGVFATRSPHRPNPIGMSAVRLVGVEGLTLHVRGVDMVDGTPVLDLKPYVVAADSIPDAGTGWLASADPIAPYEVVWSELAREQAAWLAEHGVELIAPVERALALGPEPHAYRRIRREKDGLRLAVKEWRVRFADEGGDSGPGKSGTTRRIKVLSIDTGYREDQLLRGDSPTLVLHRAFRDLYPLGGSFASLRMT